MLIMMLEYLQVLGENFIPDLESLEDLLAAVHGWLIARDVEEPLVAAVLDPAVRVVHLQVEDCSEELLRKQSYAIKNQLVAFKASGRATGWFFMA